MMNSKENEIDRPNLSIYMSIRVYVEIGRVLDATLNDKSKAKQRKTTLWRPITALLVSFKIQVKSVTKTEKTKADPDFLLNRLEKPLD